VRLQTLPPAEPLDLDSLIERVKAEATRLNPERDVAGETSNVFRPPVPPSRRGQSEKAEPQHSGSVSLRDLLGLPEASFLAGAYQAILGRDPDPSGSRIYLEYLERGGRRTVVIASLLWSAEARSLNASVRGLEWTALFRRMRGKRLLTPVLVVVDAIARFGTSRPSELMKQLGELRLEAAQSRQALSEQIDAQGRRLAQLVSASEASRQGLSEQIDAQDRRHEQLVVALEALESRVESVITENQVQHRDLEWLNQRLARLTRDFDFSRSDLIYQRTQLHEFLLTLKQSAPSSNDAVGRDSPQKSAAVGALSKTDLVDVDEMLRERLDVFYATFEDGFRGTEEEIKASLQHYLRDIEDAGSVNKERPLLDLGTGRGEWLSLLAEQGIPAAGADTNSVTSSVCRERGLDVQRMDALAFLRQRQDASVGAVSAFHLIEHLPFPVLYELLEQANRVLCPGGVLLLETPNPENVLVGSHTFYHDPTHRNPMTPTATAFLVRYFGFTEPEIRRLHPYPETAKVAGNDALTERVNGHLCGPQDFAIIARKPSIS